MLGKLEVHWRLIGNSTPRRKRSVDGGARACSGRGSGTGRSGRRCGCSTGRRRRSRRRRRRTGRPGGSWRRGRRGPSSPSPGGRRGSSGPGEGLHDEREERVGAGGNVPPSAARTAGPPRDDAHRAPVVDSSIARRPAPSQGPRASASSRDERRRPARGRARLAAAPEGHRRDVSPCAAPVGLTTSGADVVDGRVEQEQGDVGAAQTSPDGSTTSRPRARSGRRRHRRRGRGWWQVAQRVRVRPARARSSSGRTSTQRRAVITTSAASNAPVHQAAVDGEQDDGRVVGAVRDAAQRLGEVHLGSRQNVGGVGRSGACQQDQGEGEGGGAHGVRPLLGACPRESADKSSGRCSGPVSVPVAGVSADPGRPSGCRAPSFTRPTVRAAPRASRSTSPPPGRPRRAWSARRSRRAGTAGRRCPPRPRAASREAHRGPAPPPSLDGPPRLDGRARTSA